MNIKALTEFSIPFVWRLYNFIGWYPRREHDGSIYMWLRIEARGYEKVNSLPEARDEG